MFHCKSSLNSMMALKLIMISLLGVFGRRHNESRHMCIHDTLYERTLIQSEQLYQTTDTTTSLKKRQEVEYNEDYGSSNINNLTFSPLRIVPYYGYVQQSLQNNATLLNHIKNNLIPTAISWFNTTLAVHPVVGNLFLSRACQATLQQNNVLYCSFYTNANCGPLGTIVSQHYGENKQCTSSSSCQVLPSQTGIPNADTVVYVFSQSTPQCLPNVLAYASVCQQDQYNRPIAGYINFCPDALYIPTTSMEWSMQIGTTVHEMSHILGISLNLFSFYPHQPSPMAIFYERGMNVTKVVTPKVLQETRNHFGCPTLNGYELESQGPVGTYGSHPEKRVFYNDYMTGVVDPSVPVVFSRMTLALFEDSGWYSVNYTQATPLNFGLDKGCSFALSTCLTPGNPPTSVDSLSFCSTPTSGCSADGMNAVANCSMLTYSSRLPQQYQYFTNNPVEGGELLLADFCPVYVPLVFESGYSDCRFAANTNDIVPYTGEIYGPSSRCVHSNVFDPLYSGGWATLQGRCAQMVCTPSTSGAMSLTVIIAGAQINCGTVGGGTYSIPINLSFKGTVTCPLVSTVCNNTCPNQCMNWGNCIQGKCVCPPGFKGDDCSLVAPPGLNIIDMDLLSESLPIHSNIPFSLIFQIQILLIMLLYL